MIEQFLGIVFWIDAALKRRFLIEDKFNYDLYVQVFLVLTAAGLLVKLDEALEKANTIVGLVDHKEFKTISANTLNTKVVIDTRWIW